MSLRTAVNDVTGAAIRSKSSNKGYASGWERIWGKSKREVLHPSSPQLKEEKNGR